MNRNKALIKALSQGFKILEKLYLKESEIEKVILQLDNNISFINWSSNLHNINLKALNLKINELIKELNSTKDKLIKLHKEWEEFKTKLFEFRNYEGIVQNSLCINTQYKDDRGKCSQKQVKS
ncbi:hypothetical protein [Mycoplasma parvum]|uniref:Uncharacterized protein n=1 Tax=Mycoplasma parvum str. Indiana TaxID=1403316 RepID=U5NCK2_9MOLU|nr:hypothetical protein [Mycoplasma parvum]AGX89157.1 hypothetical protein PRV_02095 [Mycoplasma parvum str. Indiana]